MRSCQPLLSIVIANYNYGRFLGEAIESVLSQSCQDFELIICDAASTDNSVEVIKKYAGGLPPNLEKSDPSTVHLHLSPSPITWWCSEPDGGQSDAFNKGFSRAHGRFLTWLNADDILLPDTIRALSNAVNRNADCHWFCGNFMRFNNQTGRILVAPWGPNYVPKMLQGNGFPIASYGPTTFWSREAYAQVGPIDETLHYIMDSEYWARLIMRGYKYRRINHCCWAFRMHEESKTAEFDGHSCSDNVRKKITFEHRYTQRSTGYSELRLYKILFSLWRIFDGSIIVHIFRSFFIVGRNMRKVSVTSCEY